MTFPIHYGIQENITGNNWDSVVESSLVFMNNGKNNEYEWGDDEWAGDAFPLQSYYMWCFYCCVRNSHNDAVLSV